MFFGSTATWLTPRRSAALRLACRKSSMPCSAMILAASCARARRKSSARCEYFLGIGLKLKASTSLEYRFLAFGVVRVLAFIELRLRQIPFNEFFHDPGRVIRARKQSGLGRNAHADDAVGNGNRMPWHSFESLLHEIGPGRHRDARCLVAVIAERAFRIEPGPARRHHVAIEAIEPGIMKVVAGAGFAGDVVAVERTRPLACAALDDIGPHVGQQVRNLRAQDLRSQVLHWNQ